MPGERNNERLDREIKKPRQGNFSSHIPWFRQLPDGRYVEVRRRPPGEEAEVFTRQELLDRFGFTR